jgi:hypothetical protein
MNNPVSNDLINKAGPPSGKTLRGSIILEHKLVDPVRMNNYFLLSGKINNGHR